MIGWSARRRIIYLLFTFLVLGLFGAGFYYFYQPAPTCLDGVKNQDEVGVDCGGVCPTVCSQEVTALRILWSRVFPVGNNRYDAVALVKNPNPRHGIQRFDYLFKIWDQDNLLISTRRGASSIFPDEELIISQNRLEVGQRVPTRATLEFSATPVWQKMDREFPNLSFSDKQLTLTPTPQLTAKVKNLSLTDLRQLTVTAVLSDENLNALAISSTVLENLPKGESAEIFFNWPASFSGSVSFVDLYEHFNLEDFQGAN